MDLKFEFTRQVKEGTQKLEKKILVFIVSYSKQQ